MFQARHADGAPAANLRRHFGVMVAAKKMMRRDGSVFEPIIGNPAMAPVPTRQLSMSITEHDTAELFDTMDTGMGPREQPLMLVISTAGFDPTGPGKQFWDECVKMLAGSNPMTSYSHSSTPRMMGMIPTASRPCIKPTLISVCRYSRLPAAQLLRASVAPAIRPST